MIVGISDKLELQYNKDTDRFECQTNDILFYVKYCEESGKWIAGGVLTESTWANRVDASYRIQNMFDIYKLFESIIENEKTEFYEEHSPRVSL